MTPDGADEANVIRLTLHGHLVGYLAGFRNGKNVFRFADEFRQNSSRPTLSLITHTSFPRANELMAEDWVKHQRLHPTFSNLLPEGALRELTAQRLKIHVDNEFPMLRHLGLDLPGAMIAEPLEPDDVPTDLLSTFGKVKAVKFDDNVKGNTFSLAGVQMKFSMKEADARYHMPKGDGLGDWIIKSPSTQYKEVPANEYTAMMLASLVGVDIPEIKLVELGDLDRLPPINLPDEEYAFAIKRFDREAGQRIHMEDFAQVLVKYAHEKYNSASYEQIARILWQFSGDGLADTQQFARRLLANILLANGDAHLKNWSLVYRDKVTPRLSPAYDIVTTSVYIDGEHLYALNLGVTKAWYDVSYANFKSWAVKSGLPWRAIKRHLDDAMQSARSEWPATLKNLPMREEHRQQLVKHWRSLHQDFRIE